MSLSKFLCGSFGSIKKKKFGRIKKKKDVEDLEKSAILSELGASIKSLKLEKEDSKKRLEETKVNLENTNIIEDTIRLELKLHDVKQKLKIAESTKFLKSDDWREFRKGYWYTNHEIDSKGMRCGEGKKVFVDMSQPRPCSYSSKTDWAGTAKVTETIKAPSNHTKSSTSPTEYNGITPRQLRAIWANIERRCVPEGWTDEKGKQLKPEDVNLYHANRYVILPFTVENRKPFVEVLPSTDGPQLPRFFVSHWWGEPVKQFIKCLDRAQIDFRVNCNADDDSKGGGFTDDTPVWVCAHANNQWALGDDITDDPKESGFTKAMAVANGRTITVLDKKGKVFTRIWCIFELNLTLVDTNLKEGIWAVYTAHKHKYIHAQSKEEEEREAVGIISGGATSDMGMSNRITVREESFPFELIKKSLTIKVEKAVASEEDDRIHILNSIVGKSGNKINDVPYTNHEKFEKLNNCLKANFACSAASLQGAAKKEDDVWKKTIEAMSRGDIKSKMRFDFESSGSWSGLTASRAIDLVAHLPLTIEMLTVKNADFGREFIEAVIDGVKEFHNLKFFMLDNNFVGETDVGQEVGVRLAEVLASHTSIEQLYLWNTDLIGKDNLKQWGNTLLNNKKLTYLGLDGVTEKMKEQLREATKDRSPQLDIV